MTRHQKIELINRQLEGLDAEALEDLVKLLKRTAATRKHVKQRLEQPDEMDEESRAWLEAELTPALPSYEWGEIDPLTLGEPLRFVRGKWVNK